MDAWLTAASDAVAEAAAMDPAELDLDPATTATILDLARIAAHDSGQRTNAPLLCFMLGLARGRGAELPAIADAVRQSSS